MESAVLKRSVVIGTHKTSVSLEYEVLEGLKAIAKARQMTVSKLVAAIDSERQQNDKLSRAIRRHVLRYYAGELGNWAAA